MTIERFNKRRARAQAVAYAVFKEIEPALPEDDRWRILDAIIHTLSRDGVEVLTDFHRSEIGLPPVATMAGPTTRSALTSTGPCRLCFNRFR